MNANHHKTGIYFTQDFTKQDFTIVCVTFSWDEMNAFNSEQNKMFSHINHIK